MAEKIKAVAENQISVYNNSITIDGHTNLFYFLNQYNYNVYSYESISSQLTRLTNMITSIESLFGSVTYSFLRFEDILKPDEYAENFAKTVKQWNPDFHMTQEMYENIGMFRSQYCLFVVNIDDKKSFDLNQYESLKDIAKETVNAIVDAIANDKQQQIDTNRIDQLSRDIENTARDMLTPCDEYSLIRFLCGRMYPSYDLAFDESQLDDTKEILAYLKQEFTPALNYFEMSNSGVELLGANAQTTYGSVIDIVEFPETIDSEYFPLSDGWFCCNSRTLTKQDARLKFSRKRSDINYEIETAEQAGSENGLLDIQASKDLVETALAAVAAGVKIVESDMHFLILANDLETLKSARMDFISYLKNRNVIATFSSDQAKTYVDSYIKLRPDKYPFITDVRYPLAFRLNSGVAVGDFDSGMTSPLIGTDATSSEATV